MTGTWSCALQHIIQSENARAEVVPGGFYLQSTSDSRPAFSLHVPEHCGWQELHLMQQQLGR